MQKAAFECIYKAASQGDFPLTRKDDASSPAIPFRVKAKFFMVREDIATYLGHLYNMGLGVEKNDEEALKWYLRGYNYSFGMNQNLGRMQQTAQKLGMKWNDKEAFPWYLKFAQSGNPFWQKEVARRYREGLGVEKDESKAFYWKLESAKNGNVKALYQTAYCYENGIGVEKNMAEAFFWYHKAAENGNSKGQFALGRFYEEGITVKKDMEQALQWYQKAAKQGDELAKNKIKEIQSM